jgi:outer membrane protein
MNRVLLLVVFLATAAPLQAQTVGPEARGRFFAPSVAAELTRAWPQPPPQPGAPAGTPLTLDQAIERGLANSRRLAELQARIDAADAAVAGRHAADRPNVAVQGGYSRTNHVDEFSIALPGRPPQVVYPDIPDNSRSRLDLQWPIYTGGRTDALARAAEAERSASGEDLAAARADLRLEITRAYWALATAIASESVLTRSLQAADAQVGDLRTRLTQGLIPPNDLMSSEAQQAHQRLLALDATNQRAIAEADLRRLTAIEGPERIVPTDLSDTGGDVATTQPASIRAVADLIALALKTRPERRALERRVTAADERARAAGSAAKPQIAVGAGYDYARPNPRIFPRRAEWNTSWDMGVNVSWSLWDGGRRAAEQGEARANANALRTRVEDFDRQVTFEVRARQLELESARAGIGAAREEVAAATEAERVVSERYRAGVATPTDVLQAQVARLQAELDRTRTLANIKLAEARLARALGQ